MQINFFPAPKDAPLERIYLISAILKTFKGHAHLETLLFRSDTDAAELQALQALDIVGPPEPSMPKELLQGASRENALRYVLEAFTEEESRMLVAYLKEKYAEHMEKILVCPMDLPVPLGLAPLAGISEGKSTGVIRFEKARDYPLPFTVHGFYDLDAQSPVAEE